MRRGAGSSENGLPSVPVLSPEGPTEDKPPLGPCWGVIASRQLQEDSSPNARPFHRALQPHQDSKTGPYLAPQSSQASSKCRRVDPS